MLTDTKLSVSLEASELDLLSAETRASRPALQSLPLEDFVEHESSGRVFDRDAVIASLAEETGNTRHAIHEFQMRHLQDDVALVTYRIESFNESEKLVR
ncbi:MAG: hypothetical protein ACI9F9_002675 [Candidatus Paceibacteria bacterium]|jgi:hypothetical protein